MNQDENNFHLIQLKLRRYGGLVMFGTKSTFPSRQKGFDVPGWL